MTNQWARLDHRLAVERAGDGDCVAILSHGLTNDRVHCPLIIETGELLLSRGFTVLRVDFSGSGESPGLMRDKTISTMIADLVDVIDAFVEKRPVVLWGRSLGATISLAAAHVRDVVGLILVSPVIDSVGTFAKYRISTPFSAMPERLSSPWIRGPWELHDRFFDELPNIDRQIGEPLSVPALVIQGLNDAKIDPDEVRRRTPLLLPNAIYHESPNGDHNFTGGEEWVIGLTDAWLEAHAS